MQRAFARIVEALINWNLLFSNISIKIKVPIKTKAIIISYRYHCRKIILKTLSRQKC